MKMPEFLKMILMNFESFRVQTLGFIQNLCYFALPTKQIKINWLFESIITLTIQNKFFQQAKALMFIGGPKSPAVLAKLNLSYDRPLTEQSSHLARSPTAMKT